MIFQNYTISGKIIENNCKMKKGPAVSIVLPNYNSFKFINSTIKSIVKQSYTNWKLIIVDDCSDKNERSSTKNY